MIYNGDMFHEKNQNASLNSLAEREPDPSNMAPNQNSYLETVTYSVTPFSIVGLVRMVSKD